MRIFVLTLGKNGTIPMTRKQAKNALPDGKKKKRSGKKRPVARFLRASFEIISGQRPDCLAKKILLNMPRRFGGRIKKPYWH